MIRPAAALSPKQRCELWDGRLPEAWLQFPKATDRRGSAQLEHAAQVPSPDGHFAVRQAQRYERAPLEEYRRVLEMNQDLLRYGTMPPPDI